ncbi:MAG: hypothetical protein JNG89_01455 [Planctomycetaceae bacterium]|nr:hypothetical protein [Planctomycetaceae bacterium]
MTRSLTLAAVVATWFCLGTCQNSEAADRQFVKVGPRGGVTVGRYVGPNWRPVVTNRVAPQVRQPAPVVREVSRPTISFNLDWLFSPPTPPVVTPVEYTFIGPDQQTVETLPCNGPDCSSQNTVPQLPLYLP